RAGPRGGGSPGRSDLPGERGGAARTRLPWRRRSRPDRGRGKAAGRLLDTGAPRATELGVPKNEDHHVRSAPRAPDLPAVLGSRGRAPVAAARRGGPAPPHEPVHRADPARG